MSAEGIIKNPPKEFTEPCKACGVLEFQLGVKHAEERIIELLTPDKLRFLYSDNEWSATGDWGVDYQGVANDLIALIKGESQKANGIVINLTEGETE